MFRIDAPFVHRECNGTHNVTVVAVSTNRSFEFLWLDKMVNIGGAMGTGITIHILQLLISQISSCAVYTFNLDNTVTMHAGR